jgi:hypothetical protein
MTLDAKGREVPLPTETITRVYHEPDRTNIVPVQVGYVNEGDRHTYTLADCENISQSVKEPKPRAAKLSKLT